MQQQVAAINNKDAASEHGTFATHPICRLVMLLLPLVRATCTCMLYTHKKRDEKLLFRSFKHQHNCNQPTCMPACGCAQSVLLYQVLHVAGNVGGHLLASVDDLVEESFHIGV